MNQAGSPGMREDANSADAQKMIAGQHPVERPGVALKNREIVKMVGDDQVLPEVPGNDVHLRRGVGRQRPGRSISAARPWNDTSFRD